MKATYIAVLVVAFSSACAAEDDPSVSLHGVNDLTPDNFDVLVNGQKHALVEFYAPWCGHCKRMTPEFKLLGEHITGDARLNSRVLVAKVDADKHGELGSRFDVKGFPTILYFARGKAVKEFTAYQGGRKYADFLKFLEDQLEADKGFARSPAMDKLASSFLAASSEDKAGVIAEAEAAVAELAEAERGSGSLYVKFMTKAVAKGTDYLEKEYQRLERIISSGAVSPAKMTEAAKKASVLTAFIPSMNPVPAEAAEVATDGSTEEAAEE